MQITKRNMLAVVGTAAASTAFARTALGGWEPNERYPDPAVQILDPSFAKYRIVQATVERIATGCRWNEGPVYFGDGRYLLWSDIPNNRIMGGTRRPGAPACFASRPILPMATPATGRAAW